MGMQLYLNKNVFLWWNTLFFLYKNNPALYKHIYSYVIYPHQEGVKGRDWFTLITPIRLEQEDFSV